MIALKPPAWPVFAGFLMFCCYRVEGSAYKSWRMVLFEAILLSNFVLPGRLADAS